MNSPLFNNLINIKILIMVLKVIHHGHDKFKSECFNPIRNRSHWNKPSGGLWTSPIASTDGWLNWCEDNHFSTGDNSKSFVLELNNPKIFTINSPYIDDKYLVEGDKPILDFMKYLNYEMIVDEGYDVIHLTTSALYDGASIMSPFYGWDCETILILNLNII